MNFRLVFKVAGKTLMVEAITMLLPLLVCLVYVIEDAKQKAGKDAFFLDT